MSPETIALLGFLFIILPMGALMTAFTVSIALSTYTDWKRDNRWRK